MVQKKDKREETQKGKRGKNESRRRVLGARKKTLEEGGIFADVDKKSFRRPASGGLDDCGGNTVFSECSGTSCSHRLPGDIVSKEGTELGDEERASGDVTGFCEPERRRYWM